MKDSVKDGPHRGFESVISELVIKHPNYYATGQNWMLKNAQQIIIINTVKYPKFQIFLKLPTWTF